MRLTGWGMTLVLATGVLPISEARAIPAWARKHNVNCSFCHGPAVPRLNAQGFAFKWAGYRMPEEIGKSQEVKQISDYLAARFNMQYVWQKTESKSADVNAFVLDNATIFVGGPIGKWFGAFLEFSHSAEGVELVNNLYGVWGKPNSYGGARVGQMHWLLEGAVAGFDRPTGISAPAPLDEPLTEGGVPFSFGIHELGMEAFYVGGMNRLSFELLNGINSDGMGDGVGSPHHKDFAAIDQFIFDDNGSGITAVAYRGSIDGLDPTRDITSHYNRYAVSANKIVKRLEFTGGYVYGKDTDLPIGSNFSTRSVNGWGAWGYAGYTFPNALTAFGRLDYVNSNRDVANTGNTRYVFGSVLPVNLPEYLRLAAEYTLDNPHAPASLKRNGFTLEAMLNF
jgi:hypothetical protein